MARFRIPASPGRSILNIDFFKGIDLYNAAGSVDVRRSPQGINMIRDQVGKVRKRMGYRRIMAMPGRINGVHTLGKKRLVHAGTVLYAVDLEAGTYSGILSGLADRRSISVQFHSKLYILDGEHYIRYDGTMAGVVSADAYIPTFIISRSPTGGGTLLEPLNLCQPRWTETFLGTASAVTYQLTADNLGYPNVLVAVMSATGAWQTKTEGTHFTVNRTTGTVTFIEPPGLPPITGVDNVKITAYKNREGYAKRINGCDVAIQYGVGGAPDRLFVAGNPDYPNIDYYSAIGDPSYFADTDYSVIGQDDGVIMGYTVLSNMLAAYKSQGNDGRTIVVRTGVMEGGRATFPIINTLIGEGAVCKRAFANLGNDPLFLTAGGIYGITAEELTGEKYSQHRSLMISPALREEAGLEDAFAFVWRDFYLLAVGGKIYVMDGLQKEYAKDTPYSSYQYECYLLTNVDARVMWEEGGGLWFGDSAGRINAFYTDPGNPASYNDNGAAIHARWDTTDFSGKLFYKNKTFRYLAVRLAATAATGITLWAQAEAEWHKLMDTNIAPTGDGLRTLGSKIRLRNLDKVRLRLENTALNQPFCLQSMALEFTETVNYKSDL